MTNVLKCVRGMLGQLSRDVLRKQKSGNKLQEKNYKGLPQTPLGGGGLIYVEHSAISGPVSMNLFPAMMKDNLFNQTSTISRDSHQNFRLHTGARVNVVLLTYSTRVGHLLFLPQLRNVH